ncbi:MAG: hypothetical protein M1832_001258 [Thelocarpon impressellum]|nr:MAG: hypothetical protein M1832_001258 [Thelocarpon impressellum]
MDLAVSSSANIDPPPLLFGPRPPSPHPARATPPAQPPQPPQPGRAPVPRPPREMDLGSSIPVTETGQSLSETLPAQPVEAADEPPSAEGPVHEAADEPPSAEGPVHEAADQPFSVEGPEQEAADQTVSVEGPEHAVMDTTADRPEREPRGESDPTPASSISLDQQPSREGAPATSNVGSREVDSTSPGGEQSTPGLGQDAPQGTVAAEPARAESGVPTGPPADGEAPAGTDTIQTPPPRPPPEPEIHADSDASMDSDDEWEDYEEDVTGPDEDELREIEAADEVDGTDHDHFEKAFFFPLDDPEHIPAEKGRIDWTVQNVRGSREKPNTEFEMRSPPVRIAGFDWSIQFYPKGNDTNYMSVYLECSKPREAQGNDHADAEEAVVISRTPVEPPPGPPAEDVPTREETVPDADTREDSTSAGTGSEPSSASDVSAGQTPEGRTAAESETSHGTDADVDWGIAAQFGVVMYNPDEPRTHVSCDNRHRFSRTSSDRGWTRFCGPYNRMHVRDRGQRQPLLRHDTLSFTAYIRVVRDETCALWADPRDDPYPQTGKRALRCTGSGGNYLVAALSAWASIAAFRDVINRVPSADPREPSLIRERGLVLALQKIFHELEEPSPEAVTVQPVMDHLTDRGFDFEGHVDVVECWELLRRRLDRELQDTEMEGRLADLFDGVVERPARDGEGGTAADVGTVPLSAGKEPSFCLPVKGGHDVQTALAKVLDGGERGRATVTRAPKFMQLELERQEFDTTVRKWSKVVDQMRINEELDLRPWTEDGSEARYTLFGSIVHEGGLQANGYYHIARPGGPGTKWFADTMTRNNKLRCLTRKQALEGCHGVPPGDGDGTEAVAYVLMYVRRDVVAEVLQCPVEPVAKRMWRTGLEARVKDDDDVDVQVFHSDLFKNHKGKGLLDVYSLSAEPESLKKVYHLSAKGSSTVADVQERLAALVGGVKDPRQCRLWAVDVTPECQFMPQALAGSHTLKQTLWEYRKLQWWLHIVPTDQIPTLPPAPPLPPVLPSQRAAQGDGPRIEAAQEAAQESAAPASSDEIVIRSVDDDMVVDEAGAITGPVSVARPAEAAVEDSRMADQEAVQSDPNSASVGEVDPAVSLSLEGVPSNSGATVLADAAPPSVESPVSLNPELAVVANLLGITPPGQGPPAPGDDSVPLMQPPPPAETSPVVEPTPPVEPPPPKDNTTYILLKWFDVGKQSLRGVGVVAAQPGETLDEVARAALELPKSQRLQFFRECQKHSLVKVGGDEKVNSFDMEMVIAQAELDAEEGAELEIQGDFTSVADYMRFLRFRETKPEAVNAVETRRYFSGMAYTAQRKNGRLHGWGKFTYGNGDVYGGRKVAGRRHGQGVMQFANGDVYDGAWRADAMHGEGKMVYGTTGNTYVGGWRAGRRHGRGVMHFRVADEEQQLCQICYEGEVDALFYDCGHVCACVGCAKQLANCPVCRKRVVCVVRMYRA